MAQDWDRDGATLPVIVRQPGVMSGEPVFRGTRVPASTLFVQLAAGDTLDEVLDSWPTLDRGDCILALDQARRGLEAAAPTLDDDDLKALRRIRMSRDDARE